MNVFFLYYVFILAGFFCIMFSFLLVFFLYYVFMKYVLFIRFSYLVLMHFHTVTFSLRFILLQLLKYTPFLIIWADIGDFFFCRCNFMIGTFRRIVFLMKFNCTLYWAQRFFLKSLCPVNGTFSFQTKKALNKVLLWTFISCFGASQRPTLL